MCLCVFVCCIRLLGPHRQTGRFRNCTSLTSISEGALGRERDWHAMKKIVDFMDRLPNNGLLDTGIQY